MPDQASLLGTATVHLDGRPFAISGNPADAYFNNAQAIALAQAPLCAWVRKTVPQDGIIIDAGGNIGLTALLLSSLVPAGHVHVFEALPANAAYLRENMAQNGITNVTVNAVALGARAGSVCMAAAGAGSHVVPSSGTSADAVPMIALDSYVETARLQRVDFVKIDVEGFEPAVIEGAAAMLERFAPPVFMEFNTWCLAYLQGHDVRRFAQALWDACDVRAIDRSGAETPLPDVMEFMHHNIVRHGAIDDILLRPKRGTRVRTMAEPTPPLPDLKNLEEIARLQATLHRQWAMIDAMERSTSWRLTAPVRAVRRLLRGRS